MMNSIEDKNYKKKMISAAAGGLLLFALICGCGREENMIIIGIADEQSAGMMSDEYGGTSLLRKGQPELLQGQSGFRRGNSENLEGLSESQQGRSSSRQEPSEPQQEQDDAGMVPDGQMLLAGQQAIWGQEAGAEDETYLRIYVCGAVANPGVVSVPEGSRVEDALREAGGFAPEAMEYALNLADWVFDGQMLYFPAEGEDMDRLMSGGWPGYGAGQSAGGSQNAGGNQNAGSQNAGRGQNGGGNQSADAGHRTDTGQNQVSGLVNINTADAEALATLPGIGESRAQDIIAYREKNGGFGNCEDIMKVSGIKTSVYEKICDKITVK